VAPDGLLEVAPAEPAEGAYAPIVERQEDPVEPTAMRLRAGATPTTGRWLEEGLVTGAQARAIGGLIGNREPTPDVLEGLVGAGLLIRSQAAALRRAQSPNGHALVALTGGQPALSPSGRGGGELGVRLPRLSLDARKLGAFLAAAAFVGAVWAAVSLLSGAFGTPRHPAGVALLDSLRLLGGLLALVGGRRMYRGTQNGKLPALIGLVIYALASVLLTVRRLGDPVVVLLLLGWAVLYYLTAASRFRTVQSPLPEPRSQ
jgi:hypothetical protein